MTGQYWCGFKCITCDKENDIFAKSIPIGSAVLLGGGSIFSIEYKYLCNVYHHEAYFEKFE